MTVAAPPISRVTPHISQMRLSSASPARSPGSLSTTTVGVGSGTLPGFVITGWARGSDSRSLGLTIVGAGKNPDTVGVGKMSVGKGTAVGGSSEGKGSAVASGWGAAMVGTKLTVGSGDRVGTAGAVGDAATGVGMMGEDWNVVRALTPKDNISVRMAAATMTAMKDRTD